MIRTVRYIERKPEKFVSLERAFREIASNLSTRYSAVFDQVPYSSRVYDSVRNLLFFRTRSAGVYHVTGHVNYMGLRFPPDRTVLSIMDVRFVNMNSGMRRFILKKLYLDLPVRRLRYITAISASVRDEIVSLTGCPPEKIRVLDLPLLSHLNSRLAREFNSDRPVILQVGTMVNKNIPNLARALNGVSCKLVIIGELDTHQLSALDDNIIEFENLKSISDDAMRKAYQEADIVTFCSTYEGFGLPIIEAQAIGKPVVTSDLSPMKETAGGSACLVDPFDPESIRAGIHKVINEPDFRAELVEAGLRNVERFAPKTVAMQYERLYDEIIENLGSTPRSDHATV